MKSFARIIAFALLCVAVANASPVPAPQEKPMSGTQGGSGGSSGEPGTAAQFGVGGGVGGQGSGGQKSG